MTKNNDYTTNWVLWTHHEHGVSVALDQHAPPPGAPRGGTRQSP